jgi:hypothetical protein
MARYLRSGYANPNRGIIQFQLGEVRPWRWTSFRGALQWLGNLYDGAGVRYRLEGR